MSNHYETETEIERVVTDFETCRTGKDEFHHSHHLIVAVAYLQRLSTQGAISRMRENLLQFLNHHEVDPQMYNETMTVFWVEMVAGLLKVLPDRMSLVEKCNRATESLSNSKLALDFYSQELLWSQKARDSFVDPDLKNWKKGPSIKGPFKLREIAGQEGAVLPH